MQNKCKNLIKFLVAFAFLSGLSSCKKFVEIPPPTNEIPTASVFSSNTSAASSTIGLFATVTQGNFVSTFGNISALSADEQVNYDTGNALLAQAYNNALVSSDGLFFDEIYQAYIYPCNDIIGHLPNSSVSPTISTQLLGEAKFMRAFFYFYLTNLYGDVPLVTTTDYQSNRTLSRAPQTQVYQLILADLLDAQKSLNTNYIGPDALTVTTQRTIPNKWAATAMLARVYLYMGKYADAEAQATAVIGDNAAYSMVDLNSVFLANNSEAILQLSPSSNQYDVAEAKSYILVGAPGNFLNPTALSVNFYNSFEPGDNRQTAWIGSYTTADVPAQTYYYPYKYKVNASYTGANVVSTEYFTLLRLAEQFLIRAEARAQQNNTAGAISDLNIIRIRAGLPNYAGPVDMTSVLAAIQRERRVELFSELGHRWLDLKRTGQAAQTLTANKGFTVNSNSLLYPIPITEIQVDANLTQNPGYK